MKELVNGYVIFLDPDDYQAMRLNNKLLYQRLGDKKWKNLGKAFNRGLVVALKKKGRYNLWTQLSEAHPPFKKLFEDERWGERLNTLNGWKKEIAKVMLRDDRFSHLPNLQS